jgi:cytoskeletal protein CcmA (bactofilin family)
MVFQKNKFKNELVNTIIGEDSSFKGVLHTQRSLRVEGSFEGEINSQGEVFIGEKSKVKANIFGRRVEISGEVIGNIEASSGLHICKTGKVYGDLTGDHLLIEEGAIYKGRVNMDVITSKNGFEGTASFQANPSVDPQR